MDNWKLYCGFIFVMYGLSLWGSSRATVYTVGDSAGWDISTDLGSWPVGKNFTVGDVLVFQFSSLHSVCHVNNADFDSCTASNALQSNKDGNFSFPLSTPGPKFFICGTLSHCLGGMKLLVNVNGSQAQAPGPMTDRSETGPRTTTVEAPSTTFPDPSGKANNNNSPLPGFSSLGLCHRGRDSLPAAGLGLLITLSSLIRI